MANAPTMEAQHESGSIIAVSRRYDLRTLRLLAGSGYTHVRMVSVAGEPWGWEAIETAIDSATPRTALEIVSPVLGSLCNGRASATCTVSI